MAQLKIQELRGKTEDQLKDMLKDLKKEALNLRFQKTTGELEKTHRFTEVRKTIARIVTLQKETKLGKVVAKKETAPKAKKEKKSK